MFQRVFRASAASAALCTVGLLAISAAAKPPDLPVDSHVICAPADANAQEQPAVTGDEYRDIIVKVEECPTGDLGADASPDVLRMLAARRMYRIGGECLRKGDLDMAANCYQETHLLAPTSRYGLLAMDRLSEIEARKSAASAEEQQDRTGPGQSETPQTTLSPDKARAAQDMFRIGERCRVKGDTDMAVNCYHEAMLLCPGSSYARRAEEALRAVETTRSTESAAPSGTEEQEPPLPNGQKDSSGKTLAPSSKPPITAEVIEALQQILNRREAENKVQCLDIFEEQTPAPRIDEEQDEDAKVPPQPLLVTPPARQMIIQEPPQPSEGDTAWLNGVAAVLQQATGLNLDVDASRPSGVRAAASMQIGDMYYKVTCDEAGYHFQVSKPEKPPTTDEQP